MNIKTHVMKTTTPQTVGGMVAADFRLAEIFSKHKIDFCCNGNRSLAEACASKSVDPNVLQAEIDAVKRMDHGGPGNIGFDVWPPDLLADYIEKKHHRYVESKTPVIQAYLDKIAAVHGDRHPELHEINALFSASSQDLAAHMKKEELVLFPHVRKLMKATLNGKAADAPHYGSVQNPIAIMMKEHEAEGDRFEKISALTDAYTPPADACNTYLVTFAMLAEFEKDLHLHIHLENNVLFPAAAEMESTLKAQ